jgi:pilin isopeptide linkage protein
MAPVTVFAEDNQVELQAVPVELKLTGDTPSTDATFTFELTPLNDATPMPSGSQGASSVTATITGAGKVNFGTIYYPVSYGIYTYTIKQTTESISHYTLDTSVYVMYVEVKKDSDGLWQTEVTAKKTSSTEKQDLVFTNKYTAPTPYVTPAPTPSESESPSEPESSEPTNSVETPSEPEEDTGSKTETPGTPIPDTSESSETNSPSDSDEPTYTGTSTSEVPNSEAETPVSQDTTSSVPSSTVPLSVSAPVTGNSTTPKTGDSSQVILWVALAAGSGIVLLFGFFLILRKRK